MDNLESGLPICQSCDCPVPEGDPIFNVEGKDLCEFCAWDQLRKLPKREILKEFYTVRPSRRKDNGTRKEDGIL